MPPSWNCAGASAFDRPNPIAGWRHSFETDQSAGRGDQWHDPVTGLPRPRSFVEHLERVLALPGRDPQSVAILLIAIPDFRALSVQVGDAGSDEMLRTIAERLHEEVPEPNLVTRLRGGEFAVVLHGLGSEVTTEALATRLLERAREPCLIGDRRLTCPVIGALTLAEGREEAAMQLLDRGLRAVTRATIRLGGRGATERSARRTGHLEHRSFQSFSAVAQATGRGFDRR